MLWGLGLNMTLAELVQLQWHSVQKQRMSFSDDSCNGSERQRR